MDAMTKRNLSRSLTAAERYTRTHEVGQTVITIQYVANGALLGVTVRTGLRCSYSKNYVSTQERKAMEDFVAQIEKAEVA